MNELTTTPQSTHYTGSSVVADLGMELTKMPALVAPVTMSTDQQEVWLRAAIDSLRDIRPDEVAAVSLEVRRAVTRPSQIVPEIARLVAERRGKRARLNEIDPKNALPPPPKHVMERRGEPMSEADTAELNRILEDMGATARYRPDGSRYTVAA